MVLVRGRRRSKVFPGCSCFACAWHCRCTSPPDKQILAGERRTRTHRDLGLSLRPHYSRLPNSSKSKSLPLSSSVRQLLIYTTVYLPSSLSSTCLCVCYPAGPMQSTVMLAHWTQCLPIGASQKRIPADISSPAAVLLAR